MVWGVFLSSIKGLLRLGSKTQDGLRLFFIPFALEVPLCQPGGVKKLRKCSFTVKHKEQIATQFAYCKCWYFLFTSACFGLVGGCTRPRENRQTLGARANNGSTYISIDAWCWSNEANVNNEHQRETSCSSPAITSAPSHLQPCADTDIVGVSVEPRLCSYRGAPFSDRYCLHSSRQASRGRNDRPWMCEPAKPWR